MGRQMRRQRSSDESFDSSDSSESEPSDEDIPLRRRPHQLTHKWRERFMRRSGFSLRHPQVRRRPKPNDEMLAKFLEDVEIAFQHYPRDRILNADETSWKIINNHMVTVADCGSEAVACEFDGNVKGPVTVIASIDAAESKLPLWVICCGKTIGSEVELREHFTREIQTGRLVLTHQENGWTNRVVVRRYRQWFSDIVKSQNLCLWWDFFSAHHEEEVKGKAEEVHIALEFIPAGLTDE
jgi:hypothetical protein